MDAPNDFTTLKTRQQTAWASGDYAVIGTTLQIVGEQLCEALDVRSGQKVLDVAAGNGNVALAAASVIARSEAAPRFNANGIASLHSQ
jgi:2-polyprenyl-3-methyl-5-hydroxy-6-metoxy-1,4-benzoquinol methylase